MTGAASRSASRDGLARRRARRSPPTPAAARRRPGAPRRPRAGRRSRPRATRSRRSAPRRPAGRWRPPGTPASSARPARRPSPPPRRARPGRPSRAVHRLCHRREHRPLVGGLVQHAAVRVRAPQGRRDVGRDHQHRRPRRPRLADGAERVGRARARGRDGDPEPPGRAGVAVGRVGGRLLVAHADQPDRRVPQRLPQRQVVHSREAEADLDPAFLEEVDDQMRAGGHGAHPFTAGALDPGWRAGGGPSRSAGGPAGCGRSVPASFAIRRPRGD